jgi:pyruvate dehydrogenase E2 component (dihydrolipoamide acetyltransferase)
MSHILRVPELGEGVESVDVVAVLVKAGDTVEADQGVIEVETEKASVEVPSDASGVVAELHVTVGDQLEAGAPILTLDTEEDSVDEDRANEDSEPAPSADETPPDEAHQPEVGDEPASAKADHSPIEEPSVQATESTMRVPELGEGVDSVDVVAVFVKMGDTVEVDQPVIEVETEKAAVEVPSTVAGTITMLHAEAGATLKTGDPIITVSGVGEGEPATDEPQEAPPARPLEPTPESPEQPSPRPVSAPTPPSAPSQSDSARTLVPAAPSVRRFAREIGIDLTRVSGTGPGGRISIGDVKAAAHRSLTEAAAGPSGPAPAELPDFSAWGAVRREPMTKIRQVTATNMARAWSTVPQVTHHDTADITELEQLRKEYRERVEKSGGKLTLTAIMVKVVASALKVFPTVNASIDLAAKEIVFKDYVHIGVAVDTERGLLVPVIRDADRKNITEISVELDDLASRARDRKLKPDEMQGASFSISNLGGIGGTGFSPIVNWPEVAILGVSRGSVEPRWIDGEFRPRLMLPLSLSYDHRLVDGADAARFVRWLAEALEEPLLLALEG